LGDTGDHQKVEPCRIACTPVTTRVGVRGVLAAERAGVDDVAQRSRTGRKSRNGLSGCSTGRELIFIVDEDGCKSSALVQLALRAGHATFAEVLGFLDRLRNSRLGVQELIDAPDRHAFESVLELVQGWLDGDRVRGIGQPLQSQE
jgi:hypothetical protein